MNNNIRIVFKFFTYGADDLIHNFTRWCDASVEGNSMAARMGGLVDPDTGALRTGAVERVDDLTVRLALPAADISLIAGMADYPAMIMYPGYDGSADPVAAQRRPSPNERTVRAGRTLHADIGHASEQARQNQRSGQRFA